MYLQALNNAMDVVTKRKITFVSKTRDATGLVRDQNSCLLVCSVVGCLVVLHVPPLVLACLLVLSIHLKDCSQTFRFFFQKIVKHGNKNKNRALVRLIFGGKKKCWWANCPFNCLSL